MRNIEKAIYHTTIIILIGVTLYLLIYFFFPIKHGMFADAWEEVEMPSMDTFPDEEYISWLKEHRKEIPYTNYEEYKEWSKNQNS